MATEFHQMILRETFAELERKIPEDYSELNSSPARKEEIGQVVLSILERRDAVSREFAGGDFSDVEATLAKHLQPEHVATIRNGLNIPTYDINLTHDSETLKPHAFVTRNGQQFMPSVLMAEPESVQKVNYIQIASIVVEGVMLVMSVVGVKVSVSGEAISKTAGEVMEVVKTSDKLMNSVKGLGRVMEGGSKLEKAKAIFELIKETKGAGIFMKIAKGLVSNMSAFDWMKTAAMLTATIVAAVATDGAALVAKIVLSLDGAYSFAKKFSNLRQLGTL